MIIDIFASEIAVGIDEKTKLSIISKLSDNDATLTGDEILVFRELLLDYPKTGNLKEIICERLIERLEAAIFTS